MNIELVYATAQWQKLLCLELAEGTTAREAVLASAMDRYFPQLDLATVPLGVFGEVVADDYTLQAGDRIELYRKLLLDPKEARRRRAEKRSE